jgi:ribosome biogenesis GTPase
LSEQYSSLAAFGLDDYFIQAFETKGPPGSRLARVVRADRASCRVVTAEGECQARLGPPLGLTPITGDWVTLEGDTIVCVLERRTQVERGSFRDLSAHILAANVDTVLVMASLAGTFRPRRIERFLVIAWQTGALPIVVLTKADMCEDPSGVIAQAQDVAPGSVVAAVSAVTGEGIAQLAAELAPGTTSVMLGPSGAGKSTLANVLGDGTAFLETSPIRSDGKGRHTTVARELVRLSNGALLIDTPGLRAVGLVEAPEALAATFSEIEELASLCRFNDCGHSSEPGCAIRQAIADGDIGVERLDSYLRLQRDQERLAARSDPRLRAERAAELRRFSKQTRNTFTR